MNTCSTFLPSAGFAAGRHPGLPPTGPRTLPPLQTRCGFRTAAYPEVAFLHEHMLDLRAERRICRANERPLLAQTVA